MKIERERMVLSLESELGAGGEELAGALGRLLRLRVLSGELLEEASKLSGIPLKLLRRYEEKRLRHAYDLTATGEDDLRLPPARDLLAAQMAACRKAAEEGPCILVDHHANAATADLPDAVSIFVHADRESRLRRVAREKGQSPEKAAHAFDKAERERTKLFKSVAPKWGRASNYDLSVNATGSTPEQLADHIVRYLETVTREDLVHPTLALGRSA